MSTYSSVVPNKKIRILYTEDSPDIHSRMVKAMGILLDAEVTGFIENDLAMDSIEHDEQYDIYIFDDNTPDSGSGSGTRLAVRTAQKLKQEGRSGIVITACASNLGLLGIDDGTSWMTEQPLKLSELHQNDVEFWFKFTERYKMIAWLATCLKEGRQTLRNEWLTSVGEDSRYETNGTGNTVEQGLKYFAMSSELTETHRGLFNRLDFPTLFAQLREGKSVVEAIGNPGEGTINRERQT